MGNCNVLFQYNYAHHNEGGGILLCSNGQEMPVYDENGNLVLDDEFHLPVMEFKAIWENVTVRNNVFADNDCAVFTFSDVLKNLQIVNNTVVLKGEAANEKLTDVNGFIREFPAAIGRFRITCAICAIKEIFLSLSIIAKTPTASRTFLWKTICFIISTTIFSITSPRSGRLPSIRCCKA